MNNDTRSANIMTWQTFKKKFRPDLHFSWDILGRQTIQPSMLRVGFTEQIIFDISIFDERKPLEIVKEEIDVLKYSWVIYYHSKHRDKHARMIQIYYK